jgi:hypothetical protein
MVCRWRWDRAGAGFRSLDELEDEESLTKAQKVSASLVQR